MKYTNRSKEEFSSYLIKIAEIIAQERKVKISDIKKVQEFLKEDEDIFEIIGELKIILESEYRREDEGVNVQSSEIISINNKGFTIKTTYNEISYYDRYLNNEMRIDEDEDEKFLPNNLIDSYSAIEEILIKNKGILEIETNRFGLKKKRKKITALA